MGDKIDDIKIAMFRDTPFAGDVNYPKLTSGGFYALNGTKSICSFHVANKQVTVSHSSAESDIIPLEACLRRGGLPSSMFGDMVHERIQNAGEAPRENTKYQ